MAGWSGTPAIHAAGGGLAWILLLETGDPYLDRYTLPMRTAMPADEVANWRERVRSAWQIVAGRHRWAAEPMADVISVIVPLTPRSDTDLVSATTLDSRALPRMPRSFVTARPTIWRTA